MEDIQTRPSEKIPPVSTFVTPSTKIISYSLHKMQKLTEILSQQGRHMVNGSQNNDCKVKIFRVLSPLAILFDFQ